MRVATTFLAVLCCSEVATAATPTVNGYWRLGEDDLGSVAGQPADSITADSSGNGNALGLLGSSAATYSSVRAQNSAMSILFDGTSNYSGNVINTGTDNFGIEIWAYPTATPALNHSFILVDNGRTCCSGYGIVLANPDTGPEWDMLYGSQFGGTIGSAQLNKWTHLALVRDNGVNTTYINGVAVAQQGGGPNGISGNLTIGSNDQNGERFIGYLDEARLFTFSPPFDPSFLLINQPVPTPTISVSPGAWSFGTVTIGVPYQETFTITNTGSATLTVSPAIATTGGNSSDFTVSLTGGTACSSLTPTLVAGASCTITVTHTATAPAGGKSTTLRITSDTGGAPGTNTDISLTSTAVGGSIPTLSEWGMFAMFVGLAGAMFHARRKQEPAGEA
jgi:hypothetical protein